MVVLAALLLVAPMFLVAENDAAESSARGASAEAVEEALSFASGGRCPPPEVVEYQNDGNVGCDAPDQCVQSHLSNFVLQLGVQIFGLLVPPEDAVDAWVAFPSDPQAPSVVVRMDPAPGVPEQAKKYMVYPDFDLVGLDAECQPIEGCGSAQPGAATETLQCNLGASTPFLVVLVVAKPLPLAGPSLPSTARTMPAGAEAREGRAVAYCNPFCTTLGYSMIQLA